MIIITSNQRVMSPHEVTTTEYHMVYILSDFCLFFNEEEEEEEVEVLK